MVLSDTVLVAIIASVPTLIASLATLFVAIKTARKVEVVHLATNSMKDALVTTTKSDAFQKGHTAGVADEKSNTETKQG